MNKQNYFKTYTRAWWVVLVFFVGAILCMGGLGTALASEKGTPQSSKKASLSKQLDQTEVGLRKEKLLGETGKIKTVKPVGKKPGENQVYSRVGAAPPMVPHEIAKYLPIKTGQNDCLACHTKPSKAWIKRGAPLVSDFHRIDRKGKRVKSKNGIYMGFYNCSTCHNVMTDAKPLVENDYTSK